MKDLIPQDDTFQALAEYVGQAANEAAAQEVMLDYRSRKADNTLLRHDQGLSLFAEYLGSLEQPIMVRPAALALHPSAWQHITWGLVRGFVKRMIAQEYAIGTANNHLSTLRIYAGLATLAGGLPQSEYLAIRAVSGYSSGEARHIDQKRVGAGLAVRKGYKKASRVIIAPDLVEKLLQAPPPARAKPHQAAKHLHPNTPAGRRNRAIMYILLGLGVRVGELVGMQAEGVNLGKGEITFYRPKAGLQQTHELTPEIVAALRAYLADLTGLRGDDLTGPLFVRGVKGGGLRDDRITEQAIGQLVKRLGQQVGLPKLSPHDCRHTWATTAARNGTSLDVLMQAGGWATYHMPMRYIEAAKIANEGVQLKRAK